MADPGMVRTIGILSEDWDRGLDAQTADVGELERSESSVRIETESGQEKEKTMNES